MPFFKYHPIAIKPYSFFSYDRFNALKMKCVKNLTCPCSFGKQKSWMRTTRSLTVSLPSPINRMFRACSRLSSSSQCDIQRPKREKYRNYLNNGHVRQRTADIFTTTVGILYPCVLTIRSFQCRFSTDRVKRFNRFIYLFIYLFIGRESK